MDSAARRGLRVASGLGLVAAGLKLGRYLSVGPTSTAEESLTRWLGNHRRPSFTRVAMAIDVVGNPPWSVVTGAAGALAFLPLGGRHAVGVGALTTAGWYSAHRAKIHYARERPHPDHLLVGVDALGSYPSGHTALVAAMTGAAAAGLRAAGRPCWPALALGVPATLAFGASRIYLGAHHLGDVLGAALFTSGTILFLSAAAECPRTR